MLELAKHLWWQLLHDEEAAKNRLAAFKTTGITLAVQILPMLAPGVHYHWTQWVAAVLTSGWAGGATAVNPARIRGQILTPGANEKTDAP